MHEKRNKVVVDEEKVHLLSEGWILPIKRNFAVVEQLIGGFKVVDHDSLVLPYAPQIIVAFALPHLQDVDDLSQITTSCARDQRFQLLIRNLKAFVFSNC